VRDVRYVVESTNVLLFWLVPIFYSFDIIPPRYKDLYELNPVAALVMALRNILLQDSPPHARPSAQADRFIGGNVGDRLAGIPARPGSILRLPVTMMTAIEFEGVSKSFGHHGGRALLRQRLLHWARSSGGDRFYALKNVSFRLEAGQGWRYSAPMALERAPCSVWRPGWRNQILAAFKSMAGWRRCWS